MIQSVIFNKKNFNINQAINYLINNNYKVKKMDETKNYFRFRQISPITLKKKGYNSYITKNLKNGIELIIAYKSDQNLEGGYSIYNTVKSIYNFYNRNYSESNKRFLKSHGNEIITNIIIERQQISSIIPTVLNWISNGTFNSNVRDLGYDKLFHLSINITTNKGTFFKLEKNEQIQFNKISKNQNNSEYIECQTPINTTVLDFIENGRKFAGDDNFFIYSSRDRNCQRFILDLLNGNNLLTPDIKNFIYQDAEGLFKNTGNLSRIVNTTTDLGYLTKNILLGGNRNIGIFYQSK
jgi:hypothetical protein